MASKGFRNFLHLHHTVDSISSTTSRGSSPSEETEGGGRDLSDQTKEGYDPALDPELREFFFGGFRVVLVRGFVLEGCGWIVGMLVGRWGIR